MHKTFGIKENETYLDREGAYLIPYRKNQVGVVQTPKGYFFLGGGVEEGENHLDCIHRECLEEAGVTVSVEEKICSADTYLTHPTFGYYFHPIQTYYVGKVLRKLEVPTEENHNFLWIDYHKLKGQMFLEMQNWVLENIADYFSKE